MKKLTVSLDHCQYPIYIGKGILAKLPEVLQEAGMTFRRKLFIISDSHVAPLYSKQVQTVLEKAGYEVGMAIVPAGESSKNLQQLEHLIGECLRFGLDRQSVIIALGGGVIGDLAGFVAATYMRGIPFIQIPTTLLAHDSSVGGKVGVNHALGKNVIGAFHQPMLVLYDVETLNTLPKRELISGFAEVVKHALIWDPSFIKWLEQNSEELMALHAEKISEAIYRGCQVKVAVVSQDEKEVGLRAILNYGHTIGHALEAVAGYGVYTHGEAVAIGMAGAVRLSTKVLGTDKQVVVKTEKLLHAFELPTQYNPSHVTDELLLQAMKRDKKVRNDEYSFVLTSDLGSVELVRGIHEEQIRTILQEIRGGKA
ncbi:3-dehydroquinate synthase [Thermoflavimicrobium daqui]|jgi:3-dehydroquinate synthase|uniref:3-dehydroquinate synthase n=1 Tax=Thermoflavimicrobium daqui TaxID=2137476 RepID=A0A364K2H3_9BACL|nr:3-dehydroquinate synthase [Thermoflavimicrobium daqui]RAL22622.1 3-dehydroquinate synthase [Thermoflavimicrobium daqui]